MSDNVRLRLPSLVAAGLWGFGYFFAGKNLVKMAGFHFDYFEECLADHGMNGVWTSSISRFQWPNSKVEFEDHVKSFAMFNCGVWKLTQMKPCNKKLHST
ncbi:hypothetical protein CTI12_AA059530 [Artemisia annua]|uniref:Uncharacterized protein n=1 Tax=Artemisia annua TaxID=35608 RepID=A0A2U1Q6S1_ARTAN|nr:hypothetical protein CTI12_AA059530 [Artemisia annua]